MHDIRFLEMTVDPMEDCSRPKGQPRRMDYLLGRSASKWEVEEALVSEAEGADK